MHIIAYTTAVITLTSGIILWVNDATRDKNELLTEEVTKLEKEIKSLKSLNGDMQSLYRDGIIFKTEKPMSNKDSVTFLNGKVILQVYEIYGDSVEFEFSFEGKQPTDPNERWKLGNIINRIPFEFEGKSYFILINSLNTHFVEFTVYLND